MAGVEFGKKIQLGLESSSGTAVAATVIYRGLGNTDDKTPHDEVEENVGYLSGTGREVVSKYDVMFDFPEHVATFEQLGYHFSAGVENIVSGSANGGTTNGYTYQYDFSTTAQNTLKSYTIEAGDNQQAEEMEYCQPEKISISGASGEPIKISSTWFGRQSVPTTFTSLSLTSVEELLFQKTKLYIDAIGGTVGTTQATNTFLGFGMEIDTGVRRVYTGEGNLYYTFTKIVRPKITTTVTFEHDATSVAQKAAWRAKTPQLLSIRTTGSALTGTGGTYSNKMFIFNTAANIKSVSPIGSQDGNDTLQIVFESHFNSTANLFAQLILCNTLAALV